MQASPSATLIDELSRRDDRALATLLALRPDLAHPPPTDLAALATRAMTTWSLRLALDNLNEAQLRLLEALVLSDQGDMPWRLSGIDDWGLEPASWEDIAEQLRHRALLWGPSTSLYVPNALATAIGQYPAGLGRPADELDDDAAELAVAGARLRRTILEAPSRAQNMLEQLASGPPVCQVNDAFRPEADSAAEWLLDHNLVVPIGPTTVELPREMGILLRRDSGPLGKKVRHDRIPLPALAEENAAWMATTAERADQVVNETEDLLNALASEPAKALRSGGVGTTVLRKLARQFDASPEYISTLLELAYNAELLGLDEAGFLPSRNFDAWRTLPRAQQWTRLAQAWLLTTRDMSRLREDTNTTSRPAPLGNGLERTNLPKLRSDLMHLLIDAQATEAEFRDLAAWLWPRKNFDGPVADSFNDAQVLGLISPLYSGGEHRWTLTSYAVQLLADLERNVDDDPLGFERDDSAETILDVLLPERSDSMTVQSDMSIIVPGPPTADLFAELELVADRNPKQGNRTVWKLTEASIRRALDAGRESAEIKRRLADRSGRELPQPVEYLINDVNNKHGGPRVGVATTYLRSQEAEEISFIVADTKLADLKLHQIAPTVAIAHADRPTLLQALRDNGYSPIAEDSDGEVLIDRRPKRRAEHAEVPDKVQRKKSIEPATLITIAEDARRGNRKRLAVQLVSHRPHHFRHLRRHFLIRAATARQRRHNLRLQHLQGVLQQTVQLLRLPLWSALNSRLRWGIQDLN